MDDRKRIKLMKKLVLVVFALVAIEVFAQTPGSAAKPRPSTAGKPKLVVAIVADQFRYDYLLRFAGDYQEGLNQLLTRGAVFTHAQYEHFPTFTSVGHAALLTGAYPSVNGIIGNSWFDRETGKTVQSAADESVQQVGGAGGRGSSPRNLLVSTLGDEMKMAGQGRNRVIGISLKDYSAILASGHTADAVYWFDTRAGNFVTSSYYIPDLPQWVKEFNAKRPADRYKGMQWMGTKLPEDASPKLYGMLPGTPFGNELIEQLAEDAINVEQLGKDADTDLLVLSFSSNDYVGHNYGPDSDNVRDVSIETDRLLGKLFRFMDARIGMANIMVVFSADHGVSPMPEVNAKRKMPGGRLSFGAIRDAVQKGLQEKFGEGNWILSTPEESIYLNWDLIKSRKLTAEEVAAEAAQVARIQPHVFRVYTRSQLINGFAMTDQVGRRVMNGYSSSRGGDLYVLLEPYFFFGGGSTTTHGSPFGYDTHVPIIFMGPGIKAGRYNGSIAVNDIAPTLATILGVEIPSGSEGRILSEIFEPR
jgi:predicted AlkP superfamily pyrophosphatase or phosphodiesterase